MHDSAAQCPCSWPSQGRPSLPHQNGLMRSVAGPGRQLWQVPPWDEVCIYVCTPLVYPPAGVYLHPGLFAFYDGRHQEPRLSASNGFADASGLALRCSCLLARLFILSDGRPISSDGTPSDIPVISNRFFSSPASFSRPYKPVTSVTLGKSAMDGSVARPSAILATGSCGQAVVTKGPPRHLRIWSSIRSE